MGVKKIFRAIRQFGLKNFFSWDLFGVVVIIIFFYIFTDGICNEQLVSLLGPILGASASIFAVETSLLALIISLFQKEMIARLAPNNSDESNTIHKIGMPFLLGASAWMLGVTLLIISLLLAIANYDIYSRYLLIIGIGAIFYAIFIIPSLIWFCINMLDTQAQFFKKFSNKNNLN